MLEYEPIPLINLIDNAWSWGHFNNYKWELIDNVNDSSIHNKMFLFEDKHAEWIETFPEKGEDKPTKKAPCLFRHFADLSGNRESFILFANEYGPPIMPIEIYNNTERRKTIDYQFFYNEYWLLKNSVKLWDIIQSNDFTNKDLMCILEGERLDISLFDDKDYFFNCISSKSYKINRLTQGYIGIYKDINDKSIAVTCKGTIPKELMTNSVRFFLNSFLKWIIISQLNTYPIIPYLYHDHKTDIFKQTFRPSSLLSLIWYEFYQVIAGERRIAQCEICKKWSDITGRNKNWKRHEECASRIRVERSRIKKRGGNPLPGKIGRPKK